MNAGTSASKRARSSADETAAPASTARSAASLACFAREAADFAVALLADFAVALLAADALLAFFAADASLADFAVAFFAADALLADFAVASLAALLADFAVASLAALLADFAVAFFAAALLADFAVVALLADFAVVALLADFAVAFFATVLLADFGVTFFAVVASLADFAAAFFATVLLADFGVTFFAVVASLADFAAAFLAAALLADFTVFATVASLAAFAIALLAAFFAAWLAFFAVVGFAAASLVGFAVASFAVVEYAAAALLADFVVAALFAVAFVLVFLAAAFDIGRVCPNRGRKGSPSRGDPPSAPGRYHRMKLRCWHLFGCALGLACGPGPADDTAAGSSSTAGTTATVDTATSDPGTDPATTSVPTTGVPTTATTGPAECPSEQILIPIVTIRIVLVLERSSSMLTLWDHDRDDLDDDGIADGGSDDATAKVTRWSSVHRSLAPALAKSADSYDYGLQLFPAADAGAPPADSACSADPAPQLPPVPHTSAELLAALPPEDAVDLAGASPTAAALTSAVAALGPTGELRVVLYIGDGAPNCADGATGDDRFESLDPAAAAVVSAATADGVQFWWIGVDASPEPAPPVVDGEPDGVAPSAFFTDMQSTSVELPDDEVELDSVLGSWLDTPEGGSCILDLFHQDWTFDRLEYAGKEVPLVDDCAEDGWQILGPGQLELCGAVCDAFKQEGGPVEVFYATCP